MASSSASAKSKAESSSTDPDAGNIALHIISPSFQPPSRVTLSNLPLTTTISEVKARITLSLPSRPPPETQRLIYRGKPLSDNNETLSKIVGPTDASVYSMHLVLPPNQTIASETTISSSSSPLPTHTLSTPNLLSTSNTSQNVLRPRRTQNTGADDSGEEHNSRLFATPEAGLSSALNPRHIVPSRDTPSQDESGRGGRSESRRLFNPPVFNPPEDPQPTLPTDDNSSTINWASQNSSQPQDPRSSSFGYIPLVDSATHSSTTTRHTGSPFPGLNGTSSNTLPQSFMSSSARASSSGSYRHPHTDSYNTTRAGSSGINGSDSRRHRLGLLTKYIQVMEHQLQIGSAPAVDDISRIRFQLFQFLDEQHRNPLEPRDSSLEALIARISCVATRADQLRMLRAHNVGRQSRNAFGPGTSNAPGQVYLASSPSGFQGAILSPTSSTAANTNRRPSGIHIPQPPNISHILNHGMRGNAGVNPAMLQPRNRHRIVIRPSTFVRSLRGFWLFIRLYFFCYILSASGTWFRYALVTLAVFAAYLSETDIPQRLNQLLFQPIQRHLENLIPLGPHGADQPHRAPDTGDRPAGSDPVGQNRNAQTGASAEGGVATPSFRDNFRGVERAVALFVASLIPGVGERHVAARNAAVERERASQQEEEQRRQEEATNAQAEAHDGPDSQETEETSDAQADQPVQDLNRPEIRQEVE